MIVQIYEIQSPAQARAMIELGIDHVGSVLISAKQWQDLEIKATIEAVQAAGYKSSLIPLFTDVDLIGQALDFYRPDIVHFCETLPREGESGDGLNAIAERQGAIKKQFAHIEIMRSIPIGQSGHPEIVASLKLAKALEPISDWFLTDTLLAKNGQSMDEHQPVNGYVGITGITCDWEIARQLVDQSDIPVILAGGIGPDNVTLAIAKTHPAGVDSCTQTNMFDKQGQVIRFKKDTDKVRTMVKKVRQISMN